MFKWLKLIKISFSRSKYLHNSITLLPGPNVDEMKNKIKQIYLIFYLVSLLVFIYVFFYWSRNTYYKYNLAKAHKCNNS